MNCDCKEKMCTCNVNCEADVPLGNVNAITMLPSLHNA